MSSVVLIEDGSETQSLLQMPSLKSFQQLKSSRDDLHSDSISRGSCCAGAGTVLQEHQRNIPKQ